MSAHAYTEDQLTGHSSLMPSMAKGRSRLRTGRNPSVWVFDGYLMAERETTAWNTVKALQTLGNKGWRVFDGYLMGGGFASCQSPQLSLDKMTPNHPGFVKSSARQRWVKRREPFHFKGFPFDTNGVESAVICSLDWSIAQA